MGNSPFKDAIEALKGIRDFCNRRERAYRGWGAQSKAHDLRRIRGKAERAIKELTQNHHG